MQRQAKVAIGSGALAGAIAGLLVGFLDGGRAALAAGADGKVALVAGGLAAGADGLIGFAAGAVLELLVRLAVWGRRAGAATGVPTAVALAVAGLASAGAAAGAVLATATRHNRFLAGGLAALAGLGAAL